MDFLRRGQMRGEFERFVAQHGDALLRTGYLMTSDLAEAEDLAQECLLRVARRWRKVRSMERPEAYAQRILVNLALDAGKRRARRSMELGLFESEIAESSADAGFEGSITLDVRDQLLHVLRDLPVRQRVVLVLRYFGDFSEAQVAEMLGCSVGTVKSTSSRGIARLRETWDAFPAELAASGKNAHETTEGARP